VVLWGSVSPPWSNAYLSVLNKLGQSLPAHFGLKITLGDGLWVARRRWQSQEAQKCGQWKMTCVGVCRGSRPQGAMRVRGTRSVACAGLPCEGVFSEKSDGSTKNWLGKVCSPEHEVRGHA
jgi:hypothetical protein